LQAPLEVVQGRLPDGLRGVFYRNGPARFDLGGRRYSHRFDGDGMVQKFRIDDDGVRHYGRFVESQKHIAERDERCFVYPAFGTFFPDIRIPDHRDEINTANTSVLPHHGRLLALWEGGSAFGVDPETLETLGPIAWSEDVRGEPFSAHPEVEADGTLWNFGVNNDTGQLVIYEIAADGRLRRAQRIQLPRTPMIHDFAVTGRHLVFLMPPFNLDIEQVRGGRNFLDSHAWQPDQGLLALVIDKGDLARTQWFELPSGFLFHMGGAWDDGDTIRLDYERYPDPGNLTRFQRGIMSGHANTGNTAELLQLRLDLATGTAHQERLAPTSEFPTLHPDFTGQRYRYRYSLTCTSDLGHPFYNALRRFDLERGIDEQVSFGRYRVAEEHIAVPKPGATDEAAVWLLGTVLDLEAERTHLTVLDGEAFADGVVFEAALPYVLPIGFHGSFQPGS
jgi:carotenoid cleavage dioxygenase